MDKRFRPLDTPVLFLIFNRSEPTSRVFEAIRHERPKQLFVAGDGPRADHWDDQDAVNKTRAIIEKVDWDCDLQVLFRDQNLGCARAVSSAISWAFESVEELIIVEDDCLPSTSFFAYCDQLIDRFRHDQRVFVVSGNNFQKDPPRKPYSYYFSRFNHCWGWATWRRAWNQFDLEMTLWKEVRESSWLSDILREELAVRYWTRIFDAVSAGEIDTWDYQWTFACWIQSGLTALPAVNLVQNIGFNDDATHTRGGHQHSVPAHELDFPLHHPPYVIRDDKADSWTQRHILGYGHVGLWERICHFWHS